jgi:outer membrane protein OmpA-like peptidoglycan-associated protein
MLAASLAPIMSCATVHADPDSDSDVTNASAIIDSLEPSHSKSRGLIVAPRSDNAPEAGVPPESGVARGSVATERAIDRDIPFPNGSARVTSAADRQLAQLGAALTARELQGARFRIAGHTSATGSSSRNQQLSEARAQAVRTYLLRRYQISPERLIATGFGATRLLPQFAPDADRQRRVEVSALLEAQ